MYIQTDSNWKGLHIGASEFLMGSEGCLTCDQAQAMTMAGYTITPADLCQDPSLYTDAHYGESSPGANDGQAGLWLWYRMQNRFPQYHVFLDASGKYQFVQVTATWSGRRYQHWVLRVDGKYYDSIDGAITDGLKANYAATGRVYSANIDVNQNHVAGFGPFETNLEPSQSFNEEVGRVQDYLVAKKFMENPGEQRGYYGPKTQKAVDAFQKAHGIQASAKYFGYWYDKTRAAANNELTI